MHPILFKVQKYLESVGGGNSHINETLLDEFAKASKAHLSKSVNEDRGGFTIRMSGIGRPLCQLQMEQKGTPREPNSPFFAMKMMYGNCVEALAIAIMKAAGVNIQAEQVPVKLKLDKGSITGTYDLLIDDKIYDVKSASEFAFNNYKEGSFQYVADNDSFGYIQQGIGYALATGKIFGGLIVVNKVTGEWCIVEFPYNTEYYAEILNKIQTKYNDIVTDKPFERCFDDEPEYFYGKATKNRILNRKCSYCPWKQACWPELQALPTIPSKAKDKKLQYYTYVDGT